MQNVANFDYRSAAISKVLLRAVTGITLIAIGAYLLPQLADAATTIASGTSLGLGYSSLYFSIKKARPFFSKKSKGDKKEY
jgi:O-antigen/teichoic acid export membrane protein